MCPIFRVGKLTNLKYSLNSVSLSEYFHKFLPLLFIEFIYLHLYQLSSFGCWTSEEASCKFDWFQEPFHWIWSSREAKVNTWAPSSLAVRTVWYCRPCCPYTLSSKCGAELSTVTNLDLTFTLNMTIGRILSMGDLFSQKSNLFFTVFIILF